MNEQKSSIDTDLDLAVDALRHQGWSVDFDHHGDATLVRPGEEPGEGTARRVMTAYELIEFAGVVPLWWAEEGTVVLCEEHGEAAGIEMGEETAATLEDMRDLEDDHGDEPLCAQCRRVATEGQAGRVQRHLHPQLARAGSHGVG